jgi:hypothetical protein
MSCYPFINRIAFELGGLTHIVKHVVFGLSLNMSDCNQVKHESDMQECFANPKDKEEEEKLQNLVF